MFRRFGSSLRRFLYGRYGSDNLNLALLVLSVVISLLNTVLTFFLSHSAVYVSIIYPLLYVVVMVLLGFMLARSLSRNIQKRRKENQAFLRLRSRLFDYRNRYFRCPKCRQTVRVPRKKGKISIRCPKCGEKFIRKT